MFLRNKLNKNVAYLNEDKITYFLKIAITTYDKIYIISRHIGEILADSAWTAHLQDAST